jgi:hypothetical protein
MLATAKEHFNEDIGRARALVAHAETLPEGLLRGDVLRGAWMMAVGATDAYFSDAYADLISRALRAKDLQPNIAIPDRLNNLRIPVVAVLRQAQGGWRWRMAARELIEEENVLSLEKIRKLFNHFFHEDRKLLNQKTIEPWITHPSAKRRHFESVAHSIERNPRARSRRRVKMRWTTSSNSLRRSSSGGMIVFTIVTGQR